MSVLDPGAARKRIRDYSAERARRNQLAQERGFSSLDTLAKARRRKEYPSEREIRTDLSARMRAAEISNRRKAEQKRARDEKDAADKAAQLIADGNRDRDNKAARWSRTHSAQEGTRFDRKWDNARKQKFYDAFVGPWRLPNDERPWEPLYDYIREWPEGFENDTPWDPGY